MRQRMLIAGSIVVGLAVSLTLGFWGSNSKTRPGDAGGGRAPAIAGRPLAGPLLSRDHGPFITGEKFATVAEAEAAAGYHFLRPDHPLANDSLILAVFFERAPGDPNEETPCLRSDVLHGAIDYSSGIQITIELVAGTGCPFDLDPTGSYQSMASTSEGVMQIKNIAGVTALVSPGFPEKSAAAFVDLTMQGVRVAMYAEYAPIDPTDLATLTAAAQTLK